MGAVITPEAVAVAAHMAVPIKAAAMIVVAAKAAVTMVAKAVVRAAADMVAALKVAAAPHRAIWTMKFRSKRLRYPDRGAAPDPAILMERGRA